MKVERENREGERDRERQREKEKERGREERNLFVFQTASAFLVMSGGILKVASSRDLTLLRTR